MQSRWSRRKFLQVAATTTAALGTRSLARADESADDRFAGFRVGMQSYTLRDFKIDRALQEIKNLGLHDVELFDAHFPVKSSDADIEAMKSKTRALGITMRGHGVNPFTKDHEANRRWFEFAKKAGIKNISADPREDAFDSLDKLCRGVPDSHRHSQSWSRRAYDKIADVLNAIKGHHPLIGACADLGHYIRSGEDPVRAINLVRGAAVRHSPQGFRRAEEGDQGRDSRPRPPGRRGRVQGAQESELSRRRRAVARIRGEPAKTRWPTCASAWPSPAKPPSRRRGSRADFGPRRFAGCYCWLVQQCLPTSHTADGTGTLPVLRLRPLQGQHGQDASAIRECDFGPHPTKVPFGLGVISWPKC